MNEQRIGEIIESHLQKLFSTGQLEVILVNKIGDHPNEVYHKIEIRMHGKVIQTTNAQLKVF